MNCSHPIQERTDLPAEERIRLLEVNLARLWDMVWWMNLPKEQRDAYKAQGFTDPIESFYEE